jgi:secreted PhoX family phosphatase
VAGADVVNGATEVFGTMGNCSGGQTPWMTALSCEENYQDYYGEDKNKLGGGYQWFEAGGADQGQIPEHYGWVVELDPYSGVAKKRTAMGRFRHENVAVAIGKSGKVVAYMGDDKRDECVYKFITAANYDASNRDANMDILDEGTLYVADFGKGRWIPVVFEGNEAVLTDPAKVGGYTIASQADVLTYCAQAARALGGTRTDRPEDIEINPANGDVYIAFTNNSNHGNFHGQIVRLMEKDGDHEALTFNWDIFAVGGPQSGFSSPDNLVFDTRGDLWMVTDVSSGSLNKGIYTFLGNNSMFYFPTANAGNGTAPAYHFASGPVEAEMTGPTWLDSSTLILAVQHPGEETEDPAQPTSTWPDGPGTEPRAGVVAITGPFNQTGPYNPMYYLGA